ncbi:BspA family leucine-rich repeat surface protein [Acinetobacter sp. ANC 5502]
MVTGWFSTTEWSKTLMVNLVGKKLWSDVRLLESHEYAQGGENGNMNEQAKALLNRTEYLRGLLEQLQQTQQSQQDWQTQYGEQISHLGELVEQIKTQLADLTPPIDPEPTDPEQPSEPDLASSIQTSFPLNTQPVPTGSYCLSLQIKQGDQIRSQRVEYTHQDFTGSNDLSYGMLVQRLLEKAGLGYTHQLSASLVECYAPFALNQGTPFDVNGGSFGGFDTEHNLITQSQSLDLKIVATDPSLLGENVTDLSSLFQSNGVMPDWVHSAGYVSSFSYDPNGIYCDYPMLLRTSATTTEVELGLNKGVQKIDWGDGSSSFSDEASSHSYAEAGEYLISVEQVSREAGSHGNIPTMVVTVAQGIQEVVQWYSGGYEVFGFALNSPSLQDTLVKVPPVQPLVFSKAHNPIFLRCSAFNDPNVLHWDVSSYTDFSQWFQECHAFNQPIGATWDFSNKTSLASMFYNCRSFNQDLGMIDVSQVSDMDNLFFGCTQFNQDLSQWCVTNITEEPGSFRYGSPLSDEHCPVWGTCPSGEPQFIVAQGAAS